MTITTLKKEETLSEVVRRVYEIKGSKAKELAKEAEARLLKANPHFNEIEKLPEGAMVVVPDFGGVQHAVEDTPMSLLSGLIASQVKDHIPRLRTMLENANVQLAKEIEESMTILKSANIKALAQSDPSIADHLASMSKGAKVELQNLERLKTETKNAFTQLAKDSDDFMKMFK